MACATQSVTGRNTIDLNVSKQAPSQGCRRHVPFYNPVHELRVVIHGDDFTFLGTDAALDWAGRASAEAGVACKSVQWGVWGAVGMAARGAAAGRLSRIDVGSLAPAAGLVALLAVARGAAPRPDEAVVCVTRRAYWRGMVDLAGLSTRRRPDGIHGLVPQAGRRALVTVPARPRCDGRRAACPPVGADRAP